jgi:hypothetical protein
LNKLSELDKILQNVGEITLLYSILQLLTKFCESGQ